MNRTRHELAELLREYARRQTGYIYGDEVAVLREAADALAAAEARAAEATAAHQRLKASYQKKDAQACTFECERDEARAELAAARAALAAAEDRAEKLEQALGEALATMEQLGERDLNHDGFAQVSPVDESDCRLCIAVTTARAALAAAAGDSGEPGE